ncbi:MAG TPA: glycine betaine ABC transporter substrate-binding protein, partial [Oleiagrimonas sp.]|nr:glycine betaine ABC transporter substrate-binding protein [Oleiagrimonas sp.]
MRSVACLVVMLLCCSPWVRAAQSMPPTVVIGSKNFTESVVLGEIARLTAREDGLQAQHRRSLGGTRILWRALREGDIDVYAEYTGTLTHELLHDVAPRAGIKVLRERLARYGI